LRVREGARTPFTAVRDAAVRLEGGAHDYDALMEMATDRRFVLLGEATHGTSEFYRMRDEITRRLVGECGFDGVAVEGDCPDSWRVSRYVQGQGGDDAEGALADFRRFPVWMWRNRQVAELVRWLRGFNTGRPLERRVGFYGLDLYSLYRSAEAVIGYLDAVDPDQAQRARRLYACLDHACDPQAYGYEAAFGIRPNCREAAVAQLVAVRARMCEYLRRDGVPALDAQFYAERNAEVVVNAETYYRAMFSGRADTWNLRDAHMRDMLLALSRYCVDRGGSGRLVVWAHNSHIGDARATEARRRGEWNLGQLMREHAGDEVLLVGFTTYAGRVAAASRWGGDVELKTVRPALADSYEHLFRSTRLDRFFLPLHEPVTAPLDEAMLERFIGVIYLPETERASHYYGADLRGQFDAVFHLDETDAVDPLDVPAHWEPGTTAEEESLGG